ncbi:peptidase S8/S53 domain-containing protein [Immersiella caudata]|uniref:Peptidase S8/S53 domain-containing protein n=1 Tax=Immersiella caudata TaxID=314043 RepID=A0AA40C3N9_9PEZI|nr:peptidase S8/S53 domain-containing protein [Immersiella caudata]
MDYLERLSKHLRFERILKYVALPKLNMETETSIRRKSRFQPEKKVFRGKGLSDLVEVFKWLRKHNVEQIVKVMVIDDGEPSHSDAAIEEALKDFKVEVWDWKKLDLCSDVIAESSNCVKEVSLYSSGSKSVLMGWASEEGLRNKTKFPELEQVNLFIREGLEDAERLKRYIHEFSARLTLDTQIRVRPTMDDRLVSYASEFQSSETSSQSENAWIECVSNFSRFLRRAPNAKEKDMPIKIAVIDDGVDGSLLSLDDKIVTGKSFCPYANSTDLMSPYYVSSGNHGTCMATLICKLCPEVSLYVARLDERQGAGSSQRQITTKSAAEAIQWATDCDVDIISMSWTIEAAVQGNDEMLALKTAVDAARAKNILMFCSTSDQGSSTKDDCYPGDFDGCIKIGGATTTGEPLAWVNTEKVQFLLPGNNVPFSNNEGKVVSYESGSSVATAAASGLAGLLLFCGRLVDKDGKYGAYRVKSNDRYVQETLKDTKNMMRILDKMCIPRTKFIAVQETLEGRFNQALNNKKGSLSANDASLNLRQKVRSSDLSKMEWDADGQCMEALQFMLSVVNLS